MNKLNRVLVSLLFLPLLSTTSIFAADSAGISGTVTTLSDSVSQKHIELRDGWNLVGIDAELTLDELKEKLGNDNILVINGPGGVYKKDSSRISFTKLEKGKGYYIKLASAKGFDYTPSRYNNLSIDLVKGWNKINPTKELTLEEIQNQLANSLLIVRGGDGKLYKAGGRSSFTKFTEPYGYMIKVSEDTRLDF
jgi:hypothetical protein